MFHSSLAARLLKDKLHDWRQVCPHKMWHFGHHQTVWHSKKPQDKKRNLINEFYAKKSSKRQKTLQKPPTVAELAWLDGCDKNSESKIQGFKKSKHYKFKLNNSDAKKWFKIQIINFQDAQIIKAGFRCHNMRRKIWNKTSREPREKQTILD